MDLDPDNETLLKTLEVIYDEIALEEVSEDDFVITDVTPQENQMKKMLLKKSHKYARRFVI